MRRLAGILLLIVAAADAGARSPDGRLNVIRTPNNGVPAIVTPGQTFEAVLARKVDMRLVGADGTVYALQAEGVERDAGTYRPVCTVPAGAPAGIYALEALENGQPLDRNERAVYLRDSFPAAYAAAHLAAPRVGMENGEDALRKAVAAVNEASKASPAPVGDVPAAFVFVTGDLTQNGTPEQYQALLAVMDTCNLPTFVCPGERDAAASAYFGPDSYSFVFGNDGYIVYRARDSYTGDDGGAQSGRLQVFRRAIKPCRWSIGVSNAYTPESDIRSQIVLFIDDPLHYLVAGVEKLDEKSPPPVMPWGLTRLLVTPPTEAGAVRALIVTGNGVKGLAPMLAPTP